MGTSGIPPKLNYWSVKSYTAVDVPQIQVWASDCCLSQHSVLINGIPRHIHDVHPALKSGHSATDENDYSSGNKQLLDGFSGLLTTENVTANWSDDSQTETMVHVPLQRVIQTKRPPSPCITCDHEFGGA